MKICYICPDLGITIDGHKGASSHIRGFIKALQNLGHEVLFITTTPLKEEIEGLETVVVPIPELVYALNQTEYPRTFRALRHLFYNFTIEETLKKVLPSFNPDYIYERYSPFSVATGAIAKRFNIPHILEVNAPLAEQGKLYRKQALQEASELLELTALQQADLIIALADELREWLEGIGIASEKIAIRGCGVDTSTFSSKGNTYTKLFEGKIVLGFIGSLKPWHDIEMLAALFRAVADDPRFHLLVIGDGPMRGVIDTLKGEFPGRITATGAIDQKEVAKYGRAIDIALAPYPNLELFYFSPLKVFEYMSLGKALIATDIGQLKTLVQNDLNGLLAPPEDVESWVAAVRFLADNPEKRESLGAAAEREAQNTHSWEQRAKQFCTIIAHHFSKEISHV